MSETVLFDDLLRQPEFRSIAETIATQNANVDPLLGMSARVIPQEQPEVADDEPPGYRSPYQYPPDQGSLRVPRFLQQQAPAAPDRFADDNVYTRPTDRTGTNPLEGRFRADTDVLERVLSGLRRMDTQPEPPTLPRHPYQQSVEMTIASPRHAEARATAAVPVYPRAEDVRPTSHRYAVPIIPGEQESRIHYDRTEQRYWAEPRYQASERAVGSSAIRGYGAAQVQGENIAETSTAVQQAVIDTEGADSASQDALDDEAFAQRVKEWWGLSHDKTDEPDGHRGKHRAYEDTPLRRGGRFVRRLGTLAAASAFAFAAIDAVVTRISQH